MNEKRIEVLQTFGVVEPTETPLPRNDDTTATEWHLKPQKNHLIDPKMDLNLQFQVKRVDGNNTVNIAKATDKIALINFCLQTFWKSAEVHINKTSLGIDNHFGYSAYVQALRDYSAEARDGTLASSCWFADEAGEHQSFLDATKGYATRRNMLEDSPIIDLHGPLFLNLRTLTGMPALPDNVQIDIKLHRNNNKFILVGDRDDAIAYEITLVKADLSTKRIRVPDSTCLFSAVSPELKGHFNSFESRHFVIPAAQSTANFEAYEGYLPKRMIMTFLEQSAFTGNYQQNPLRFRDGELKRIYLQLNNKDQLPATPYELDMDKKQFSRIFFDSMEALGGKVPMELGQIMTTSEYRKVYFMVVWDLQNDKNPGPFGSKQPWGVLRVVADFAKQLANPIVALCLFEFDKTLCIAKDGTTRVEWA